MPLHDKYVVTVWKQYTGYLWENKLINTIVDCVINVAYGLLSIIYSHHFVKANVRTTVVVELMNAKVINILQQIVT